MTEEIRYIKLKSSNCPACVKLADALEARGISAEVYDVESLEGKVWMEKVQVMSVPVLLKVDSAGEILDQMIGFSFGALKKMIQG